MIIFKVAAIAASLFMLSANLYAQSENYEEHGENRHSFWQISQVTEKESEENLSLTGVALLGRYDLTQRTFLRAEIERVSDVGIEEKGAEIALAYTLNPHSPIEFHLAGLYGYREEEESGASNSEEAYGAEMGFHAAINEHIVFHGEMAWLTSDGNSSTGAALGLFYRINEKLGLNAEYAQDEESNNALELGVRLSF